MTRFANPLLAIPLLTLLIGPPALQTPPASSPAVAVTLVDGLRGHRLIDPRTGEELWRADADPGALTNLIAGPDGRAYASVAAATGTSTSVSAIDPGTGDSMLLGQVPGLAVVAAVDVPAHQLRLLAFPPPAPDRFFGPPVDVVTLPLPTGQIQAAGAVAVTAARDEGFGLLSPTGEHWYGIRPTDEGPHAAPELLAITFASGEPKQRVSLQLPALSGYRSLLLAPDGTTLYIIDYHAQVIHVVDASPLAVRAVLGFGRSFTKRPPCAAALSAAGDRLYVLGNSGPTNAGDGILVFDTAGRRLLAHFPSGRDLYCLAASPDGTMLYATTNEPTPDSDDPWLMTIDAASGQEMDSVPLRLGEPATAVGPVAAAWALPGATLAAVAR